MTNTTIKGYIISRNGACTLKTHGRYKSKDLLCHNLAHANGENLETLNFDISEVRNWASVYEVGYSHHFLVARVRGVCALVIKKHQDKSVIKELKKVTIENGMGDKVEKLKDEWLMNDTDESWGKYISAHDAVIEYWKS